MFDRVVTCLFLHIFQALPQWRFILPCLLSLVPVRALITQIPLPPEVQSCFDEQTLPRTEVGEVVFTRCVHRVLWRRLVLKDGGRLGADAEQWISGLVDMSNLFEITDSHNHVSHGRHKRQTNRGSLDSPAIDAISRNFILPDRRMLDSMSVPGQSVDMGSSFGGGTSGGRETVPMGSSSRGMDSRVGDRAGGSQFVDRPIDGRTLDIPMDGRPLGSMGSIGGTTMDRSTNQLLDSIIGTGLDLNERPLDTSRQTDGLLMDRGLDSRTIDRGFDGRPMDRSIESRTVDRGFDGRFMDRTLDGRGIDRAFDGRSTDRASGGRSMDMGLDGRPMPIDRGFDGRNIDRSMDRRPMDGRALDSRRMQPDVRPRDGMRPTSGPQTSRRQPRVRKEYRQMTDTERELFHRAINMLKADRVKFYLYRIPFFL